MKTSAVVSVAISTFAGGLCGYLESHVTTIPTDAQQWEAILFGGVLAGIIAVAHLYQEPDSKLPLFAKFHTKFPKE